MIGLGAKNRFCRDVLAKDTYDNDLPQRQVLSVCEHFSFRPMISFDCLNISTGLTPRVYFDRFFARYVTAEPFDPSLWAESFDLIICEDSYQEYADLSELTNRVYELLKPEGFCYLCGRVLAGKIPARLESPDGRFCCFSELAGAVSRFWIHDYGPLIEADPERFCCDDLQIDQPNDPLSPFVWVLTKMK